MAHTHGHAHDDGHDGHDHGLHHHHHAAPGSAPLAFAVGTALNLAFVVIEAVYGVLGHSIALLSDAGHNLGDGLSLAAAWAAALLAQRAPSLRYTYGLRSFSILVALFNAIVLLIAVGAIILEAVERLAAPEPVAGLTVIVVALIGVGVHGVTALFLSGAGLSDLNVKAAYAHMAADAAVGIAVAASGGVILYTGWLRLDPIVSIVVAIAIVVATWRLLRQALDMALDAVPAGIDAERVREHLAHLAGVSTIHDLHIWPMSTTETALTAHLVMPGGHPGDDMLAHIAGELHERFAIGHVTLQIETDPESACRLAPDHVV
ncbi:MAG TPA: cation diffusion facilitator family transporter [Stellaceae bacterium]|nr:cation diffusion facilitator family transporter [Stellaceae bacterium]